jgi:hypothetical protein
MFSDLGLYRLGILKLRGTLFMSTQKQHNAGKIFINLHLRATENLLSKTSFYFLDWDDFTWCINWDLLIMQSSINFMFFFLY